MAGRAVAKLRRLRRPLFAQHLGLARRAQPRDVAYARKQAPCAARLGVDRGFRDRRCRRNAVRGSRQRPRNGVDPLDTRPPLSARPDSYDACMRSEVYWESMLPDVEYTV